MRETGEIVGVRVHIPSFNTAAATELTIRTLRRLAGSTPFDLVVGDSGSIDGSIAMLERLERRGWLTLERAPENWSHARWLDHWVATCPARFAVFSDSDMLYRRFGWLDELTGAAEDAALVTPRVAAKDLPRYVHPISGAVGNLAPRPAPWLFLVNLEQVRGMESTFGNRVVQTDAGAIFYDVGARYYEELCGKGLVCVEMGPEFASAYRHWGGLSWKKAGDRRLAAGVRARQAKKALMVRAFLLMERSRRQPIARLDE